MEKIILSDNTELEIKEGASLGAITVIADSQVTIGEIADKLMKSENLNKIKFISNENVTGVYEDMILELPLFRNVDIVSGIIYATFAIRQKTDVEKRLDALENSQSVQDGAITDLGNTVDTIAGGSIE